MYIYHALINALSARMIHINLNMIFYTHVKHSPTKTIYTHIAHAAALNVAYFLGLTTNRHFLIAKLWWVTESITRSGTVLLLMWSVS